MRWILAAALGLAAAVLATFFGHDMGVGLGLGIATFVSVATSDVFGNPWIAALKVVAATGMGVAMAWSAALVADNTAMVITLGVMYGVCIAPMMFRSAPKQPACPPPQA